MRPASGRRDHVHPGEGIGSRPDRGHNIGGLPASVRRRLHGLRRLLPAGLRRRLSAGCAGRGSNPTPTTRSGSSIRHRRPTRRAGTRTRSSSGSSQRRPHLPKSLETIADYRDSLLEHRRGCAGPARAFMGQRLAAGPGRRGHLRLHPKPVTVALPGDRFRQLDQVRGRARRDGRLQTRIVSIDPRPRAEVDELCDRVLRVPLEAADLSVFDELSAATCVLRRIAPHVHELGCDGLLPRGPSRARRRSARRRSRRVPAIRLSARSPTATTRSSTCWPPI